MNKKITKSQNNQVLTGTLAGIAEYFGINPTTVRVIYVFASIFLIGAPILLYILLMILVPTAKNNQPKQAEPIKGNTWSDF
ncbi:PspC domain-containing protein [Enterococcus dongliensis]|uniref:PspC domain-containing protein n=1 Tax=Enterococcus dongliensis TaxID=2559925 RepID=A0AAW8TKX5_9ENTE|nr:PspC domain-containing protein [Enterococcus dongliensis]MDT2604036.1 PspC domain-containing protein [Enterococcus dongliensis]MDT2614098.1 PspC domain-containing protein [Enterococcus dongliensis]MDT2635613.1 PspC domain-containing protein [Enterococcus dongliensis]MDT2638287.1 PspC domain-containing protein [Enterococcus dongliensis]MDT2638724.1 PspC domain-containing protein [Enterococcus dongliensis]